MIIKEKKNTHCSILKKIEPAKSIGRFPILIYIFKEKGGTDLTHWPVLEDFLILVNVYKLPYYGIICIRLLYFKKISRSHFCGHAIECLFFFFLVQEMCCFYLDLILGKTPEPSPNKHPFLILLGLSPLYTSSWRRSSASWVRGTLT